MSEGFRQRARRVQALLFGPSSAFVLVASPAETSVAQALPFLDRLAEAKAPICGVVLNRVRRWPAADAPPRSFDRASFVDRLAAALAAREEADFPARAAAEAARDIFDGYAAMVRRDEETQAPLLERARSRSWFSRCIPELPADVHDLEGLSHMADVLFEDAPAEPPHGR
jgi:MinD-like ATPase involved in chromosome partitioning or flagellar assembly